MRFHTRPACHVCMHQAKAHLARPRSVHGWCQKPNSHGGPQLPLSVPLCSNPLTCLQPHSSAPWAARPKRTASSRSQPRLASARSSTWGPTACRMATRMAASSSGLLHPPLRCTHKCAVSGQVGTHSLWMAIRVAGFSSGLLCPPLQATRKIKEVSVEPSSSKSHVILMIIFL